MKNKIIILASLVVILLFGFLYMQNSKLIADDKDGKGKKDCSTQCTKKSSSTEQKENDLNKMGGASTDNINDYAVYEFITDKIHCDGCKSGMKSSLIGISGVKEINFGETCSASHMTNVKVYFSSTETTPEVIAASVKEKRLDCTNDKCPDGSKCTGKNKTEKKL